MDYWATLTSGTTSVRVRSGPGTSYDILYTIPDDSILFVTDDLTTGDWRHVYSPDGLWSGEGWALGLYINQMGQYDPDQPPPPPPTVDYYHNYNVRLGSFSNTNFSNKQKTNALFFARYLIARGVTLQAACAMLANWQHESTLNPNTPQANISSSFPNTRSSGFGLPQWTSWGNKIGWYADQQGVKYNRTNNNPIGFFEFQWEYHDFECINGLKGTGEKTWYDNHGYTYTWANFKASQDAPSTLARAYYWQYERSSGGETSATERAAQADAWYDYLENRIDPGPEPGPEPEPEPDPPPAPARRPSSNWVIIALGTGITND